MKIAIFTDCYLDLTGGIVTVIDSEKQELEHRGHTVYVFSSAYPKSAAKRQSLAKKHIYPVPSCKLWGRGATPIARRPRVVEKWLLRNHPELRDFDIFYVHYEAGCSIAGLRLGRQLGIPTVQVMHGREDRGEELIIFPGFRTLVAAALDYFHSWYLPHPVQIYQDDYLAPTVARVHMWSIMVNHANAADLIITPSEFFRKMLVRYGATRPVRSLHHALADKYAVAPVQPRALNITVASEANADSASAPATPVSGRMIGAYFTPDHPLEIIWHSRLCPEKRILPFLRALSLVQGAYHLSIYGEGIEAVQAKTYAKTHHLNVTFHGAAKFDKIWDALQHAHLDVLVSYDYDTFGVTLIEAEAAGVPTLICDPNLTEIVPSGGFVLAESPSPVDLASALDDLIAHPERLAKMSKAMLAHRSTNRISAKIDQLEQIFQDLITHHSAN